MMIGDFYRKLINTRGRSDQNQFVSDLGATGSDSTEDVGEDVLFFGRLCLF
jgi:hypothetical protein